MPTYNSRQFANAPASSVGAHPGNTISFYWEVPITTALTTSDAINFGVVPKGFRVLSGCLEATDMDSGTTLTINVGDAGSATRFFSASTVGQAGTASTALVVAGQHHIYTADTIITAVAAAGPATTTGTLIFSLVGRVEGQPS